MKYTSKIAIFYFIEAENGAEARAKLGIDHASVSLVIKPLISNIRLIRGYYSEEPETESVTAGWEETVKDFTQGGIHGRQRKE